MQNKVTLIGYYGGDKTHCLSAWQSTNIDFEYTENINSRVDLIFNNTVKQKKKTPQELLKMLADSGHGTPFEKSTLHFQLTAELASHIHLIKHRIGVSVNSESARYKELKDKWYIPSDWHDKTPMLDKEKIGCIHLSPNEGEVLTWQDVLNDYCQLGHELYHKAINDLSPSLGRKRAKESARYFLPYAKQLDFDCMFNFRSFVHFQGLRNSPHAQVEIQQIAQSMLEQVKAIPGNPFQYSLEAFGL